MHSLPSVPSVVTSTATIDEKIIEELVFNRMRLAVDFGELMTFHEDLSASVERALARCMRPMSAEQADLTMRYVRLAWDRLGEEVLSQLAEMTLPLPARSR